MAGGIVTLQRNGSASSTGMSGVSAADLSQGLGWFSVGLGMVELLAPGTITRPLGLERHGGLARLYGVRAIGTGVGILTARDPAPWIWGRVGGDALDLATLSAGLGERHARKGSVLLALAALAGVTAVDLMCAGQLSHEGADGRARRNEGRSTSAAEAEIERSITIGKPAQELHQLWRDPKTLPAVMAFLATVRASGDGRMHWRAEGPLGRTYEWDTEFTDDRPGDGIGWRSLPGAAVPNAGSLRFHPATGGRGTVARLRVRFDPPGGALGEAAAKLFGNLVPATIADKALHRFKSLAETGEIPTTAHQPAARADTR